MRVKGVSKEYAELLGAAGVDTVKELKVRNPGNLAQAMATANRQRKLVRLLPSERVVARWIDNARGLAAEDPLLTSGSRRPRLLDSRGSPAQSHRP